MLWVDKYRPTALGGLTFHDEITERLRALASNPSSLPHLFVYGPEGSGKSTRISCLLREIFGASAAKLKLDKRTFTTPTGKSVDINMITSPHHVELSPGDAGLNDRYVVQEVIKEIASTKNVRSVMGGVLQEGGVSPDRVSLKVVVLTDVDRLTKQAQAALRRTMEKYAETCRLILCCNSPSKLIGPLRSRCLGIRIPAPRNDEICKLLKSIGLSENFDSPEQLVENIAQESNRNARRAMLMYEAARVQGNGATQTANSIPTTDWELYIRQLAADISREQSPQRLMAAREKLYELLVSCIPARVILKALAHELIKSLDDSLKLEVLEYAAFYEHRLAQGSKEIFHLEAFVAKFMAIYKKYLNELFG